MIALVHLHMRKSCRAKRAEGHKRCVWGLDCSCAALWCPIFRMGLRLKKLSEWQWGDDSPKMGLECISAERQNKHEVGDGRSDPLK